MAELISTLTEAISAYIAGYIFSDGKYSRKRILYVSVISGILFFIGYGILEVVNPSKYGSFYALITLLFFSLLTILAIYALLSGAYIIALFIKKHKHKRNKSN